MCRAVTEAKNEVMERKRDLDTTKEKMDKLVEKLYLGRLVASLKGQNQMSLPFGAQWCHNVGFTNRLCALVA